VVPVIRGLARQSRIPLSIDTYKAEVARAALDEGAVMINDISGLRYEPELADVAARAAAAVVLMHSRGRSIEMYVEANYRSVPEEVASELARSIDVALGAGVSRDAIIVDPGLGFGKRAPQSADILANLDAPALRALDRPLLVGPSRKSFLDAAIGPTPPTGRDWATAAAVTAAILLGAHIVRVHRVPEMVQVVRVADLLRGAHTGSG
jgi:dihydropteroate synthase